MTELTSLVRYLAIGQHHISPPTRVCGIYASIEHPTNAYPTLQESEPNNAKVVGMINGYNMVVNNISSLKGTKKFNQNHSISLPKQNSQINKI
ncbi:hypothetical protein CR513_42387, partial [Mucuna pruriens]